MTTIEKIDSLIKPVGLSRRALAERSGVPYSTIASLFAGQTKQLSAEVLVKISKTLEVPVSFLLGTGPFQDWEVIDNDRVGILKAMVKAAPALVGLRGPIYGVEDTGEPLAEFVTLLDEAVKKVRTDEGQYAIELTPAWQLGASVPEENTRELQLLTAFRRMGVEEQQALVSFLEASVENRRKE